MANEETKKFKKYVEELEKSGAIKTRQEIIEALEWNKSGMSSAMSLSRDVPRHIYRKFVKVYRPADLTDNGEQIKHERLIKLEAMSTVILGALAEILAHQRGQPVTKVSNDLVSTVNSQVEQLLDKLQ